MDDGMDNLEIQEHLLDLLESGYEVLTESERFAHQLQRRFRSRRLRAACPGWTSPAAGPLNHWLERFWKGLWPEDWPAPPFLRWRLLSQTVVEVPPPAPLSPGPLLVRDLDESFELCLRYGIDPGSADAPTPLVDWRSRVWLSCRRELEKQGLFYPALLPRKILSVLERDPKRAPLGIAMVGFEFAGQWEKALIGALSSLPGNRHLPLPSPETENRALVYSDPQQEVMGLLEHLARAAEEVPLHSLAVVVLDAPGYSPLLAGGLQDLFGLPLEGDQAAYNLFPEPRLTDQSLYHAALLPLTFAHEGESRQRFTGFLRSPYYAFTARHTRALSQWDRYWREKGIEGGLEDLTQPVPPFLEDVLPGNGRELRARFRPLMGRHQRPGSHWVRDLKAFWEGFGFPLLAHEIDQIAWDCLQRILDQFEAAFGETPMTGREFTEWLQGAGEKIHVQRRGLEDAGIQVLGGLEIRGLSFQRVYVPALMGKVLPQPVRSFPFLTPHERRRVQGGTAESQFQFAGHLFAQFHAAAPRVMLSRPLLGLGGDPEPPSPFWPDDREEKQPTRVPWRHFLPGIQRARWVRAGIAGMKAHQGALTECPAHASVSEEGGKGADEDEFQGDPIRIRRSPQDLSYVGPLSLPEELTASAVEVLVSCPARFFFEAILKIAPLPETGRGVDPRQRGGIIHRILAVFGEMLMCRRRETGGDPERPENILARVVDRELKSLLSIPSWQIEKKRLLGKDDRAPGLLTEWINREMVYLEQGWRWQAFEVPFGGLRLRDCPVSICGRVDRVDIHPDQGIVCWDYKTGRIPTRKEVWEEVVSPQVPIYLMALRQGLIPGVPPDPPSLNGGYIDLRSVRHLDRKLIAQGDRPLDPLLLDHEQKISRLVRDVLEGHIRGRWTEGSCEVSCPYECLCGLRLFQEDSPSPSPSRAPHATPDHQVP